MEATQVTIDRWVVKQNVVDTYNGIFFFLIFWLRHAACEISVPQPGIEPAPPALGVQSLNHGIARQVPIQWNIIQP